MSRNTPQRGSNEVLLYANPLDAQFHSAENYLFSLLRHIDHVKSIQLMQCNIIWSFPNVRTLTNNIVFSEQGSPTKFTIQLPVCQYTDEDVMVDLAQAMTNAGTQTYSMSENYVTESFTINGSIKNFTLYYPSSTFCNIIGLTATTTSTNNSLTLGQYNLFPTTEIQIRMLIIVKKYETSPTNLQQYLLAVASLIGYQYGDEIRENNASIVSATTVSQISQFVISLVDTSLTTPYFNLSLPMSFVMRLELWD